MTVHSFRKVKGQFRLLSPRRSARFAGVKAQDLAPVRIIEDGPVRMVIEALFGYRDSTLCLRYKLPKQGAEIEIEARVHWNEKDRMLKLALPLALAKPLHFTGQTAFGIATLPENGNEAVAQKWLALTNADQALTVINDRTYASDDNAAAGELRLTLLRSPAYAAHPIGSRPIVPEDRYSPRHEQGERLFRFWVQGGPVQQRMAAVDREAMAHNERPMALSFFPNGAGKANGSLITVSDDRVQLAALKQSEDGSALIIRLFEPTGISCDTTISLPFAGTHHDIHLGRFEIRTYRVDLKSGVWQEVNLVEENVEAASQ
jgi:alpha-mannosidase